MLPNDAFISIMFEIRSFSHLILLTRTHKQNKDYNTRQVRERLETIRPMDVDLSLTQVSPLLIENCFHPLSDKDGEEDA